MISQLINIILKASDKIKLTGIAAKYHNLD